MKKAASGGVLASAILVAHAEWVLFPLHEKRRKPLARSSRVLAFATRFASLATALCAVFSGKAGLLLAFTGFS